MFKFITLGALAIFTLGCQTTARHLSDSKSIWVNIDKGGHNSFYWCTMDKIEAPICYEADIKQLP